MITIMKAKEIMPSWAMENATLVDLAIMKVAAAVPGPQITRAAVPTNSAANLREALTSAIEPPTAPGTGDRGPHLLRARDDREREMVFGSTEQRFAEFPPA